MYEIYETFGSNGKYFSYYTVRSLYRRSLDKRKNLQFKIYDDLEQPDFDDIVSGNKSIIYDHVHFVLDEFQLSDLTDENLWAIVKITSDVLKKKYNNYTYIVLGETFKEIEKYLEKEKIKYGRLGKYGRPSSGKFEGPEAYPNKCANSR